MKKQIDDDIRARLHSALKEYSANFKSRPGSRSRNEVGVKGQNDGAVIQGLDGLAKINTNDRRSPPTD